VGASAKSPKPDCGNHDSMYRRRVISVIGLRALRAVPVGQQRKRSGLSGAVTKNAVLIEDYVLVVRPGGLC
jgi:hypothetical protein